MIIRNLLFITIAAPLGILAEDAPPASPREGHSHIGESFNEGPRQAATIIAGCGDVHLPITSSWSEAQDYFNQGLGQLHGFWYYEAERTFRQIASNDPDCAMAYWGMAMANFENEKRARDFIKEADSRKDRSSDYEKRWIESQLNYLSESEKDAKKRRQGLIDAYENIIHEYPQDNEARAFLACRLWQFSRRGLPIHSHQAVDALLDQVFEQNPLHPAHHFRIHLWDGKKPSRALGSAAVLHKTAPAIAHMWHMPGHIYDKLKRYPESVWHQEASVRVDHARMAEQRILPDQIFNYAHNSEWLARNWSHLGRARDAIKFAKSMIDNPRHPKLNNYARRGSSTGYGRRRLMELLDRYERWEDIYRLSDTHYLEPTDLEENQISRLRLLAIAHFEKGQITPVSETITELQSRLDSKNAAKEKAAEEARKKAADEGKEKKEIDKAVTDATKSFKSSIDRLAGAISELEVYRKILTDEELTEEDWKKIKREKTTLARLQLAHGSPEQAEKIAQEAVDSSKNTALPLATLAYVQQKRGNLEAAKTTIGELRELSGNLDLAVRPFSRLAWLAGHSGFEEDWRIEKPYGDDFGDKPKNLHKLGPLSYTPPQAIPFVLPDENGAEVSLENYRGKALIAIFYVGHSCSHCIEQLNAFAPETETFRKAGIELLAIGTDAQPEIAKAHDLCEGELERFPFPLLADPELSIFKQYRAFDDFENLALHATVLISPDGRVLWQDVSYEPFTDVGFLLDESKRLLEIHR